MELYKPLFEVAWRLIFALVVLSLHERWLQPDADENLEMKAALRIMQGLSVYAIICIGISLSGIWQNNSLHFTMYMHLSTCMSILAGMMTLCLSLTCGLRAWREKQIAQHNLNVRYNE